MNKKAAQEELKQLSLLESALVKVGKKRKLNVKETEAMAAAAEKYGKKSVKELRNVESAVGGVQDGVSQLTAMFKAPARDLMSQAKQAGKYADRMKDVAKATAKSSGLLGVAGKAAGTMGAAVGGVSKLLLGWPGLILMGIKAIIDVGTQLDTYVKNLNKAFAQVRGPDIMTPDVTKQFKQFNDAVFDIGRNIQDGLRPDQVQEFAATITQAGVHLDTLNQGFYSYRDAVHIAAKASKTLGIDMLRSSDMMGTMMLNLRMNLDDVDSAFVEVAYDAQKAGLTTDKFWGAVQNATHSLAFYGKFVKEISNTMKVLSESQVSGLDDTQQSVEELGQAFAKSSTQTNMAFIALARQGGTSFKKLFTTLKTKATKEFEDMKMKVEFLEAKKGKSSAEVTELERLRKEMINSGRKRQRMDQAYQNGDVAMAQEMAMATGEAPGLLLDLIKGINGVNLTEVQTGANLETVLQGIEGATKGAFSKTTVRTMIENVQQQANLLRDVLNRTSAVKDGIDKIRKGKTNPDKADKVQQDLASELLVQLGKIDENLSPEETEKMSTKLGNILDIDSESAKKVIDAAAVNDDMRKTLKDILDGSLDGDQAIGVLNKLIGGKDVGTGLMKRQLNQQATAKKDVQKAYDDTFDKIVNNTLSVEDMKDIVAKGMKWEVLSAAGIQNISSWITEIGRKYLNKKPTKAQEEAMERLPKDVAKAVKTTTMGATEEMFYAKQQKTTATTGMTEATGMLGMLSSIENIDQANLKYQELQKKGDKNLTKVEKKQLAYLQSIGAANKTILPGILEKSKKEQILKYEEQLKTSKTALEKYDVQINSLKAIDASAEEQAELLGVGLMTDPKAAEAFYQLAKGKYGQGGKLDLEKMRGVSKAIVKQQAILHKSYVPAGGGVQLGGGSYRTPEQVDISKEKPIETKPAPNPPPLQGLKTPEMVTKAGPVVLHPKEIILPAGLGDFHTKPMMMGASAAAPAGGVAGGKTITITINATERDMAQRIGNEVRGIMHKESL